MTEQRTEDYRDVLEDLARSRGLSGAEELARRVAEVDPTYSVRDVLEATMGGLGVPLDAVLMLSDGERMRITRALAGAEATAKASGICSVPGCKRPVAAEEKVMTVCAEHRSVFAAQADEEAWGFALEILEPWMEITRLIGSDELTRVMKAAQDEAAAELNRVLDEQEAARAAL